jgi:putative ABC transport system permease protein
LKFLHLIVRNALRNRLRTTLTIGGTAFLIFVLIFVMTALTEIQSWQGQSATHLRVAVQHSTGLTTPVPYELETYLRSDAIAKHAQHVQKMNWFGGYYQDPKNFFANFAVDHLVLRDLWSEFKLSDDQFKKFCETKTSAIVGADLARKFDWKIGQRVTLTGTIYACNPELDIVGIFTGPSIREEQQLFFRWDYLDDLTKNQKIVGTYWMKARSADDIPMLKSLIDGHTKNSSDPTETVTENEFNAQFMQMMGNFKGLVVNVGALVLLIVVLMTANTMAMSARERVTEVAVMRTLGFTAGHILFFFVAEAILVTLVGAALPLAAAIILFNVLQLTPAPEFFPVFMVARSTIVVALVAGVAAGFVSSIVPAARSARRKITDGLRQVV